MARLTPAQRQRQRRRDAGVAQCLRCGQWLLQDRVRGEMVCTNKRCSLYRAPLGEETKGNE